VHSLLAGGRFNAEKATAVPVTLYNLYHLQHTDRQLKFTCNRLASRNYTFPTKFICIRSRKWQAYLRAAT